MTKVRLKEFFTVFFMKMVVDLFEEREKTFQRFLDFEFDKCLASSADA